MVFTCAPRSTLSFISFGQLSRWIVVKNVACPSCALYVWGCLLLGCLRCLHCQKCSFHIHSWTLGWWWFWPGCNYLCGGGASSSVVGCGSTCVVSGVLEVAVIPAFQAVVSLASAVGWGVNAHTRMAAAFPGHMVVFIVVVIPALPTWLPTEAGELTFFPTVAALLAVGLAFAFGMGISTFATCTVLYVDCFLMYRSDSGSICCKVCEFHLTSFLSLWYCLWLDSGVL